MKKALYFFFTILFINLSLAQKKQDFSVNSPDGKIEVKITVNDKISWSISHEKDLILAPSEMSLTLDENQVLGKNPIVLNSKKGSVNSSFETPLYKKKSVKDQYNKLTINFKNDFGIEFRVFDDGAAYRFLIKKKKRLQLNQKK
ncbi:glycoside hydrolase family 97 N-terminal domain-containing protein [Flavobacterium sp. P21]|uniref:glycoside hydrolase family 97 N-terminal domain-containing protein n=1 Tax=Flavobacterium sp. P21 TaxID=3423948 RepID=UPI003D66D80A